MTYKQYFCDELNDTLTCFHDKIMSCCSGQLGPLYYDAYRGQEIDWEAFKQVREKAFALFNDKDIDNFCCRNCFSLRERTENDKIATTFKVLNISHWTQCNCGCVYCARMKDSKGKITTSPERSEYYDIVPVIKGLYANELIDPNVTMADIQGGDISVLEEFEPMVKLFLDNGIRRINIYTNNIVYHPILKELFDMKKLYMNTSLDCGSAEVYKKLKRVDKFNDTVSNLRRYISSSPYADIMVQYILIEHFNDTKEEIKKFVDLMVDIGIKKVDFLIDNKLSMYTDFEVTPMPAHFGEIYLYFKSLCEEKGIEFYMGNKRTEAVINKYALKIDPTINIQQIK